VKIIGLDGKERSWNLSKYKNSKNSSRPRSQYHIKARKLLRDIFPRDKILEEVSLPGSNTDTRKSTLFVDFFIPNRSLIVEVHGQQHYEYVAFYHKKKINFYKAQARDRDKLEWSCVNDIRVVVLKYSDDLEKWERQIKYDSA
jgi:hypothetical protein